jgi:hypothetical protein
LFAVARAMDAVVSPRTGADDGPAARIFSDGDIAMPWDQFHYPAAMKHLPPAVRSKAIEIANALLAEGSEEGKAIRIAVAMAARWAQRSGISSARELENHD